MTTPPARPKLYHITHVDNLRKIVADGALRSDAAIIARGGSVQAIGMSDIKRRRVEELEVACHPGTKVGEYVPFYFCPRSVMLYVIHCANHPELTYRGGQGSDRTPRSGCARGDPVGGANRYQMGVLAFQCGGLLHRVPLAA